MDNYNDIPGLDDNIPTWDNSPQDQAPEWLHELEGDSTSSDDGNNSGGYESRDPLGKCPHCGGDIIWGQYGAYCKNKCGMTLGKIFGRKLSGTEVKKLLTNGKILLEGMQNKDGKEYSANFITDGIEEYSYTNKDGQYLSGLYRYKFKLEFPKRDKIEK